MKFWLDGEEVEWEREEITLFLSSFGPVLASTPMQIYMGRGKLVCNNPCLLVFLAGGYTPVTVITNDGQYVSHGNRLDEAIAHIRSIWAEEDARVPLPG